MLSLWSWTFNANFKIFHFALEFPPFLVFLQPTPLIQVVDYQESGKGDVACKTA